MLAGQEKPDILPFEQRALVDNELAAFNDIDPGERVTVAPPVIFSPPQYRQVAGSACRL